MTEPSPEVAITKTQRIRDFLQDHPDAKAKEVASGLSEHSISLQLIGKVISTFKAERINAEKTKSISSVYSSDKINVELIDLGVNFVEACGSVQKAQEILAVISRISRSQIQSG